MIRLTDADRRTTTLSGANAGPVRRGLAGVMVALLCLPTCDDPSTENGADADLSSQIREIQNESAAARESIERKFDNRRSDAASPNAGTDPSDRDAGREPGRD